MGQVGPGCGQCFDIVGSLGNRKNMCPVQINPFQLSVKVLLS